jgi:hypothetical protein
MRKCKRVSATAETMTVNVRVDLPRGPIDIELVSLENALAYLESKQFEVLGWLIISSRSAGIWQSSVTRQQTAVFT